MIPGLTWARGAVFQYRLRRRFPLSTIHTGATADKESFLGKYVVLFPGVRVTASTLGPYTYIQTDSLVNHADIGPFCSIAAGVVIGLGQHPVDMVSTSPVFYGPGQPLPEFFVQEALFKDVFPRTVIGADVWIGQRAMVKSGVRIGVGAVIGAASMVTRDIPPYTVAAGNPCRPIRLRFSEEICRRLLASQWWTLDASQLHPLAELFSNPVVFLDALDARRLIAAQNTP